MADLPNFDLGFSFSDESEREVDVDERSTQPYGASQDPDAHLLARDSDMEADYDLGTYRHDRTADRTDDEEDIYEGWTDDDQENLDLSDEWTDEQILEQRQSSSSDDDDDIQNDRPTAGVRSRFADMKEEELGNFIEGQKNTNTMRKTHAHLRLLTSYLTSKGENREPHKIPAGILDSHLALFFVNVRKEVVVENDDEYEPSTIKGLQSSIERHLREKHYPESIITSDAFYHTREAIRSKCKQLKKTGKGNRPQRKRAPNQGELDKMWSTGALGCDSPKSLQHTMWWVMNTRFGKRVNTENAHMYWGDINMGVTHDGKKFITHRERETKTRQGDDVKDTKDSIKVFEDPDNQCCPVKVYEEYKRRRPMNACQPNSRFYLQPKKFSVKATQKKTPIWYKEAPHGVNSLKSYMKQILIKAALPTDDGLSNISARKHLVSTCKRAGVSDSTTIKITGHKRVESLNNYTDLAEEEELAMGVVLGRPQPGNYTTALSDTFDATASRFTTTAINKQIPPTLSGSYVFQNCTINNLNMAQTDRDSNID